MAFPDRTSRRILEPVGAYAKERAAERIARLSMCGLDVAGFFREVAEALATAVPSAEPPSWVTLDPASLLMTSGQCGDAIEAPTEWLVWEYCEDDVMKTIDLVRSPGGIHTLYEATGGDPDRCRLYREFLKPAGIEHMVEVALRTRTGEIWGSFSLVREAGRLGFDPDELDFLLAVRPHLAEGVRRGLLVGEATDPEGPDPPGLVVLGPDWEVESMTAGVENWLTLLPGTWEHDGNLPAAVISVAARALRTAEGDHDPGEVALARVLSRTGRWVILHGATLAPDTRRVAVIVEPAHPARISPLLMAAYGLTVREQDIARLVLQGDSTAQIATALFVSPHTVQQHLKGIFGKTGVRSRRELVGKLFFAHYEPRVRDNERRATAQRPIRGGPFPIQQAPQASGRPTRKPLARLN